jgi:deoxycytidylate deaminase
LVHADSPLFSAESPDAELVFGIVCAVGTDYRPVVDYLKNLLKRARYTSREIHVSEHFRETTLALGLALNFSEQDEYARIDSFMKAGTAIRNQLKEPGFAALDAAFRICASRPNAGGTQDRSLPRTAHIIISLKRTEEVDILREIYGPGFYVIGISSSDQERRLYLETEKGISDGRNLDELLQRDQKEETEPYGQRTRDTFEEADVFVDLKDDQYKTCLKRFLHLVFGYPYVTPTRDEYGMFLAYAASVRSGSLARQVGASIMSPSGDLLAAGCNDVPSPRGGLYWDDDGTEDRRDHLIGFDANDVHKQRIIDQAATRFAALAPEHSEEERTVRALESAVKGAIANLTEFGRSVHAEMDAITTCARNGIGVAGATLYTTTFPCHTCTRHIIASGFKRVIYAEPYPKSQAEMLHGDAICFANGKKPDTDFAKIPFLPFVGIGPRRFFNLFSLRLSDGYRIERKQQGKTLTWRLETDARPRVPLQSTSYLEREACIFEKLETLYSNGVPQL